MIAAMLRAWPIALLLGLAARARASRRPPFEISGGYSLARDPRDAVTLPAGWIAGAALGLTPAFSVVADVSGQYKTIALFGSEGRLTLHAIDGRHSRVGAHRPVDGVRPAAGRRAARARIRLRLDDQRQSLALQPGARPRLSARPRRGPRAPRSTFG